jgi:Rrf2 family protein
VTPTLIVGRCGARVDVQLVTNLLETSYPSLTCCRAAPNLAGRRFQAVLKVSQKLEYAMRAMIELAQRRDEGVLVPARQIAERQQVPLRFLEQQLGALSKAGLVESFRGAGGGCRLSRPPEEITMAQIADAIEGQIFPMFCLEPSDHTCFQDSRCGLQGFWADVARAVQDVFRKTTVAELAARYPSVGPTLIAPEQLISRLN